MNADTRRWTQISVYPRKSVTESVLSKLIFAALLGLIAIAPIPYGTVEPWWKATFICAVFAICIVALIETIKNPIRRIDGASILLPMLALALLALLQTISLGSRSEANLTVWNTISADPYQTRFFALQILALTAFLALLYRYASIDRRVRVLVFTVLAIAVASAVFGILRQTTQQQTGFLLPLLKQNQGFAQFINKNHFAYLMEMAFGLGVGIVVGGGVARERMMIYVALLLPVWTGLVLANSRGGIIAMLAQILVAVMLLVSGFSSDYELPQIARSAALRTLLLVILVVGILFGALWVGGDRLASNFEAATSEITISNTREGASRNEIWRATLKMFAAHPIAGVGLGGYWIGITAYHDASGLMTPQEAHNDYLELLSSAGLIGLALGVWFVVAVVRKTRENLSIDTGFKRAVRLGAVLGLTGVAAHSLVDFGLHITANAIVFVVLIMFATSRIDNPQRGLIES
ncbi:MAG TPA: O-antigen ligase family protein [Pyrinomonadaceae bacterium]|nr:O-antigen ligase family protein [Pyrinomonadaceae bacterium]